LACSQGETNFRFSWQKIFKELSMQLQPGLYRHYKGPEYRVFGVAQHSETEQPMVVYQALYGEFGLWVRPLEMFCESVEVDGEMVPRFALIQSENALITRP
jgi:hypothetical protein